MPGIKVKRRKAKENRAAIYARVSDQSQDAEDKTSITEQTSEMEAHCERRGLAVVARYQEVGQGWSKKRPEFQRMLADARRGRFDTIVCWKSDRLSRGMYPAAALMEVVEAHEINLEAVMDAIDMKTFGLMAAIGKIELDNFRERASMGKRGTAKQGRIPVSNVPYGYRVGDDGRPEIVEPEAEVVRRIYRMCVNDGLGARVIGQRLMADGVPAANQAKRWWDGQVYRVLSNETYKGTWWYGKARYISTEDGIRVHEKDKDTWIPVPFPEIVDEQTWDLAQSVMKKRRTQSGRNTKIFYLLQHLVRCTGCGMLMGCMATRKRTVKRNGKVYKYELETPRRYYKCYGVQHFRTECREHTMIRAERLEGLIWGRGQEGDGEPRHHRGGNRVPGLPGRRGIGRADRRDGARASEGAVRGGPGHQAVRVGEDNRGAAGPPAQVHHGAAGDSAGEAGRLPRQGDGLNRKAGAGGARGGMGEQGWRRAGRPAPGEAAGRAAAAAG